jgi:hypothetical protein
MAKIYLMQLLCPQRHAIVALAFDPEAMTENEARQACEKRMAIGDINPWCGICGSRHLRYEAAPTRFETMEKARPELERLERENAAARIFFETQRRSARGN